MNVGLFFIITSVVLFLALFCFSISTVVTGCLKNEIMMVLNIDVSYHDNIMKPVIIDRCVLIGSDAYYFVKVPTVSCTQIYYYGSTLQGFVGGMDGIQ